MQSLMLSEDDGDVASDMHPMHASSDVAAWVVEYVLVGQSEHGLDPVTSL